MFRLIADVRLGDLYGTLKIYLPSYPSSRFTKNSQMGIRRVKGKQVSVSMRSFGRQTKLLKKAKKGVTLACEYGGSMIHF
jgi:hypothetical protein